MPLVYSQLIVTQNSDIFGGQARPFHSITLLAPADKTACLSPSHKDPRLN
jgi:hypothetical protein